MIMSDNEMKQTERQRIGCQLREAREAAGLSHGMVAERTGLREATVRNIEDGRYNVGIDELSKVASCVGAEVNVEALFNVADY